MGDNSIAHTQFHTHGTDTRHCVCTQCNAGMPTHAHTPQAAREVQKRLMGVEEARNKVQAASRSLGVKIQSKAGITQADLEPLSRAIAAAKSDGLSSTDTPFLVKGIALEDR
jgi:hypothetical protein